MLFLLAKVVIFSDMCKHITCFYVNMCEQIVLICVNIYALESFNFGRAAAPRDSSSSALRWRYFYF